MGTPLDELLPLLLGPLEWERLRELVDANADALLTDTADGRLAVVAHRFDHDGDFAGRVEAIRNALELGRFDGFDGVSRPLSHYFQAFADGGPLADYVEPRLPPQSGLDPDDELLAAIGMALLRSLTWECRRRITVAYWPVVEHIEGFLRVFAEQPEWSSVAGALADVVADARADGIDKAFANAPMTAFLVVGAANTARPQLTRDESLQFAWLAYLQAPAWHRRRELVRANADLLLDPDAEERLRELAELVADELPAELLDPALDVLRRARVDGVDAAFAGEDRPTHVMIAAAAPALAGSGSSDERLYDLRLLAHFFDPGIMPRMWATTAVVLAEALSDVTVAAHRPSAIEEAVLRASGALNVFSPSGDAVYWRRAHEVLGALALKRTRGDRTEWTDFAIDCFERVLRSAAEEGDLRSSGRVSVRLAQAFLARQSENRAQNVEHSIAYAEQAVRVLSDAEDQGWAHSVLGQAYAHRVFGDDAENRAAAVDQYERALAKVPDGVITGSAHLSLGSLHAVGRDYDKAMAHLRAAAEFFPRSEDEFHWALIRHAMGAAAYRSRGAAEEARGHFHAALEVLDADGYPVERRRTLRELGATYFNERRWSEALPAFEEAIALGQWLERSSLGDAGRLAEIADLVDVYERAAYCLVRLGRADEALPLLDEGKTRGVRQVLDVSTGVGASLSLSDIRRVCGGEPTVVPVITTQGSLFFLLTADGTEVIDLPDLGHDDLKALLDGTPERIGWLFAYRGWREAHDWVAQCPPDEQEDAESSYAAATQVWADTLGDACGRLWTLLMRHVHAALTAALVPTGATVRVLPSKWLSLLPLHAAWYRVSGEIRAFVDDYAVVYTPSLWLLDFVRSGGPTADRRLLAVVDPTGDLPHAPAEGDRVSAFFDSPVVLRENAATTRRIAEGVAGATHLHFACHGEFDWVDPLSSGLLLADDEVLSARDVATELSLTHVELVTLSACETGITESSRLPNEYIGLAGSFLMGGARTVVSTLWSVDDESTATLIGEFYRAHLTDDATPAAALRTAQLAVRDDPETVHPFYWAPFLVTGA